MGQVKGNWLTGAHSGRACRHDDIYTRVDPKTGKCYSAKLCNPSNVVSEAQMNQRSAFGTLSAAVSAWIKTEKEANSEDYQKVYRAWNRQKRYSSLRGYMMARGMAKIEDDGSVTINVNSSTPTVNGGGGSSNSGSGSDSGSGSSGNQGGSGDQGGTGDQGNTGGSDSAGGSEYE